MSLSQEVLYRKWRPGGFAEVAGQDPIITTLRNAVAARSPAHAYLFTGPRGTGKTSTGRILAKAVNCEAPRAGEPDNACNSCIAFNEGRALDLIELDAASNRGIDEVRALRESVGYAPNSGSYKVYLVDEVHMLTDAAFNALLKTLEEPPAHVIFVLATTEPHRIPPTISSRCQRFDFRRASLPALVERIGVIAEGRLHVTIDGNKVRLSSSLPFESVGLGYRFEGTLSGDRMRGLLNPGTVPLATWEAKRYRKLARLEIS